MPRYSGVRCSTNAAIASLHVVGTETRRLTLGLDDADRRAPTRPKSRRSTARFAARTASGGWAAIARREPLGDLFELFVGDDVLGQTDAVRLVGVDLRRREDQLLRLGRADQAREALGPAEVGDDPVLELERARACVPRAKTRMSHASASWSPAPSA